MTITSEQCLALAADTIVQQEKRIAELEKEINQKADYNMQAFERIAELEAENAKLRRLAQDILYNVTITPHAIELGVRYVYPASIDALSAYLEGLK